MLGGRKSVGTSDLIYYAHIDPVSLDIGPWMTSTRTLGGARWGLSAVANDGLLYAAGGSDGSTFSTAVWHYPIEADGDLGPRSVDNDLPDDSNSTYHQAVLVPSIYPSSHPTDTVYLIGGRDDAGSTQHVLRGEIYPGGAMEGYVNWVDDPGDDLPAPLSAFAAALGDVQGAGRQVYVIGGDQGVNGGNPQKTIRSAVMDDLHNVFADWYGRTWFTSPALPEPRYYHTAVQVGEYIYAISGRKASSGPDPYYRNVLRGKLTGTGARQYAPSGAFTSRVVDLGQKHRLVGFDWNTTITPTDPGVSLTLQFRAGNDPQLLDATGAWSDLFPSDKGADVSNSILAPPLSNYPYYPPIGRYVQYRALFTTTAAYSNVTPLLREVGVRVEETPNLYVSDMRVSCNGCYGSLGVVSRTITLQLTVSNLGRDVPNGNNFFTCLFITTSATYDPFPPDWPSDAGKFLPGSYWWGLQGTDFTAGAQQTLTTTFVFAQPINIWLYAYADYNDTSQPPDYDVGEADPQNLRKMYLVIIDPNSASATQTAWYWGTQTAKPPPTNTPDPTWYWATQTAMAQTSTPGPTAPQRIFLPLVQQRFSLKFYLQLTTGESLPVPLPLPQPSARGPAPEAAPPNPSAGPLPPSQGP
mgnify:CR=1 FL=1